MPTSTQMLVFCLSATIQILTPGPNFIYILTRGTTQGRRAAMLATIELAGGVLVHTTLTSMGAAALVRSSYFAFQIIKYAGSLYLAYLGLKVLRKPDAISTDRSLQLAQRQQILWQSMIGSLATPKRFSSSLVSCPNL